MRRSLFAPVFSLVTSLLLVAPSMAAQPVGAHRAQPSDSEIGYETVAAALADLRTRPGVVFSTQNGWLIGVEEATRTLWSFAPRDYAAYPAVVRRQVIEREGAVQIDTRVLCEASRRACDDLVQTFSNLTERAAGR